MEGLKISITDYDQLFLDLSWKWLNDPEIKYLTDTPPFSKEEQKKWYDSLSNRTDYFIWGVTIDNKPIGVIGIKYILNKEGEYFGYIGEKQYWGHGLSKQILSIVEDLARSIGLNRLWLKVINTNPRAIQAYLKQGYVKFRTTDREIYMEKNI